MPLFGFRNRVRPEGDDWRPVWDDYEILTGTRAHMDDDAQATLAAYHVVYQRESGDGVIAFWTYVLNGPPGSLTWRIGVRHQWVVGEQAADPVYIAGYDLTGDGPDIYNLADADASAQELARMLAAGGADVRWDFASVFAWDGRAA